ncbi:hypothetical protein [Streptomyces sp. LS1784]|uniref:hypothetical protein n=1 Tax=Streptomyces sp. LS1784 TaxID=2851533 RepID=UPI001CCF5F75|nr:hypothetical protein [Streptomyces sp. LS1784]
MSADQPFARHDGVILLLVLLLGALATAVLVLYGIRVLVRARAAASRAMALVSASALVWATTIGLYTWGLLHLLMADDYTEARACDAAMGKQLVGYDPSFIPLKFGCVSSDGRTVSVVIPSYVNPVLAVLVVCAVTLTVFAVVRSKEKST